MHHLNNFLFCFSYLDASFVLKLYMNALSLQCTALQVLVYYLLYGNRHYSAEVPDGSTGRLLKTTRGKRTTTTKAKFEREVIQTKHIITYFFVNTRYISGSCLPWSVFGSSLLTMLTLANIS